MTKRDVASQAREKGQEKEERLQSEREREKGTKERKREKDERARWYVGAAVLESVPDREEKKESGSV